MPPRVTVHIEPLADGKHQAICRTRDCTAGEDGGPWKSAEHVVKVAAEDEARGHRQWHRTQRPVPQDSAEAGA